MWVKLLFTSARLFAALAGFLACTVAQAAVSAGDVAVLRAYPTLTFSSPVAISAAPGDTDHLFVVELAGRIERVARNPAAGTSAPFLDISDRVSQNGGEEGLLGLAFDPDFASNGHFYVNYVTRATPRRTVVSRFTAAADRLSATAGSEQVLLEFTQPYANHNGGWVGIGPDRHLYVASGDGGPGGDPQNHAQRLDTLLGKVLRIRRDGGIPADNPFVGTAGARGEIWAYGMRNPFHMGFDSVTGRLWAGDVGQNAWEEIDIVQRGGNYGWRVYEGSHAYNNPQGLPASVFTAPVIEYPHDDGCSVIGGFVYRGTAIPALQGMYLYTDYCSGTLWALAGTTPATAVSTVIGTLSGNPSGFGEDPEGEPWIATLSGRIYRLVPANGTTPSVFPALLSQTDLFSNTAALTPSPDLRSYEINAPFWSDSASKKRWFRLPAGGEIGFSAQKAWRLPVGSATVKHFEVTLADGAKHRLETRVFLRTANGWRGASYRWNTAETDASLVTVTEQETLEVEVESGQTREQLWEYPSQANCLRCHTEAAGHVLGLNTRQMNRVAGPPGANQLARFRDEGLFNTRIGAPSKYARLPNPAGTAAGLEARARAYLDVNCAQCHRPGGPTGVDMDLRWTTPAADMHTHGVAPTGGDLGISGAMRIQPGSRDHSLVWQRMRRLDGDRMPPVGSHVVHSSGVKLVGNWINAGAN